MGRMTAPTEDPEATVPIAVARCRSNHVATVATPGINNLETSAGGSRLMGLGGNYIPTAIPAPMP